MECFGLSRIFGKLPRLLFIDILIDGIGKLHHQTGGAGELTDLIESGNFGHAALNAFNERILHRRI